jgi:lipid-binding SYLF domain-containing protein
MKKYLWIAVALMLVVGVPPALAADEEGPSKSDKKRQEIDTVTADALKSLFAKNAKAKGLYDSAHGYAVFDNLKIAFVVSGGGGSGVAVDKGSGARTYMKMGTGGIGLGMGGQKYQVIFLFEDAKTLNNFIEKGWQADAAAKASAGTSGVNVKTGFRDGVAIYQITDKGLMANADIAGTKYWKNKKLN